VHCTGGALFQSVLILFFLASYSADVIAPTLYTDAPVGLTGPEQSSLARQTCSLSDGMVLATTLVGIP
jgi:hypothetical protein